jgi:multisubunit Na+/H+ antiporter MnhB subunit
MPHYKQISDPVFFFPFKAINLEKFSTGYFLFRILTNKDETSCKYYISAFIEDNEKNKCQKLRTFILVAHGLVLLFLSHNTLLRRDCLADHWYVTKCYRTFGRLQKSRQTRLL